MAVKEKKKNGKVSETESKRGEKSLPPFMKGKKSQLKKPKK